MLHTSRYSHTMHPVIDKLYAVVTDETGSKCHMFVNIPDHLAKDEEAVSQAMQYLFLKECGNEPAGATTKLIVTIGDFKGTRLNYINERYPDKEKMLQCEGGDVEHIEVVMRQWGNS